MRDLDLAVISDLHLGTYGSHAKEFTEYLESINPKTLILNGDIIDMWQFKKGYFPPAHWSAIKCLLNKITQGVNVYYLTGNHDDHLRRLSDLSLTNFSILDKLVLELDNKKYWFFHGDVFDNSVNHSKWIAQFGGKAYDQLIRLNRVINLIRTKFRLGPVSFSKRIKSNVKKAVKFIGDFENTAIELGLENNYDYVICGHIHQAKIKTVRKGLNEITYMNSGDWVESLTSLEMVDGEWKIYNYLEEHTFDELVSIKNVRLTG